MVIVRCHGCSQFQRAIAAFAISPLMKHEKRENKVDGSDIDTHGMKWDECENKISDQHHERVSWRTLLELTTVTKGAII